MGRFSEAWDHLRHLKDPSRKKFENVLRPEMDVLQQPKKMIFCQPRAPIYRLTEEDIKNSKISRMSHFLVHKSHEWDLSLHDFDHLHPFLFRGRIFGYGGRLYDWMCRSDLYCLENTYGSWKICETTGYHMPSLGRFQLLKDEENEIVYLWGGVFTAIHMNELGIVGVGEFFTQDDGTSITRGNNDLFALHLKSMKWEKIIPATKKPTPRTCFGFVKCRNRLIVLFGKDAADGYRYEYERSDWYYSSSIHIFDLESLHWREIKKAVGIPNDFVVKFKFRENRAFVHSETNTIYFFPMYDSKKEMGLQFLDEYFTVKVEDENDRLIIKKNRIQQKVVTKESRDGVCLPSNSPFFWNPVVGSVSCYLGGNFFLSFSVAKKCWVKSVGFDNKKALKSVHSEKLMVKKCGGLNIEYVLSNPLGNAVGGKGVIVRYGAVFLMCGKFRKSMIRVYLGPCGFGDVKEKVDWRRRMHKSKFFVDMFVRTNIF